MMGDQYIKIDGVWTKVTRPYIRINEIWTPIKQSWVKRSGAWVQSWNYNVDPPSIPEISLQVVDNRYINAGVRLPDVLHDPLLKRIVLLALPDKSPTTPTGSGHIYQNSDGWPNEDWSYFWFNGQNPDSDHTASNVFSYKHYPVNATDKTNLPGGKWYYFAAWAEDVDGNLSAGQFSRIWMPKDGKKADKVLVKEASISADSAGSVDTSGVYTAGLLKAHDSPRSDGVWFYGNKITDLVGVSGTPTITSATIRVTRTNDAGQPSASVRVGWHAVGTAGDVDPASFQNTTLLTGIQKGESKTFNLPTTWNTKYNTNIKGIALVHGPSVSDDIEAADLTSSIRCGELHLTWEEAL